MKQLNPPVSLLLLICFGFQTAQAQQAPRTTGMRPPDNEGGAPKTMSFGNGGGAGSLQSYQSIVTAEAQTQRGLITVHKVGEKYYFEIADSILNTDILIVNRISKSSADARSTMPLMGHSGDEINKNIIKFDKGPNNKLYVRSISFSVMAADSTQPLFKAVQNSNIQPIILALDIKGLGKENKSVLVDMTDLIKGDESLFSFGTRTKSILNLTGLQSDKSFIITVKSYPLNTEIKTQKTYGKSGQRGMDGNADASAATSATFEVNSSIVLLPKTLMQPRLFDARVGYFNMGYTNFDADPLRVTNTTMVVRWRLEPKDEDIEKCKRGELVEPKKPIVYYIDPATPAKWIPYIKKAVNDWQSAFEQAGFKNAIMAKDAPTPQEDSSWSLDDARHSVIVYKASEVANAQGYKIHDPRSGEIIESHISFYHNILSLIHDWYMIQASPSDPRARKMEFDDELMGELIYGVIAHEVGHAIGLRHNFGSSFATPVEKLRDKNWVEEHGHTASIMDYARFNYVAQPEDNVAAKGLFPRINDYDKWAIEWGYKPILDKTPVQQKALLNEWVIEKTQNPRLRFISDEERKATASDSRALSEDLSDNTMKANAYGIKNLQYVIKYLPEWVNRKGDNYDDLKQIYSQVFSQYSRYVLGHVFPVIGAVHIDNRTTDQPGDVYQIAPKAVQKEAVTFINEYSFKKQIWLLDKNILNKIDVPVADNLMKAADGVMTQMLRADILNVIAVNAEHSSDPYTLIEYLNDIKTSLWAELKTGKVIDAHRRLLQKTFVTKLGEFTDTDNTKSSATSGFPASKTDVSSVSKAILKKLKTEIISAIPVQQDLMSKYHLQDVQERITNTLSGN